jgi:hypothetical protein
VEFDRAELLPAARDMVARTALGEWVALTDRPPDEAAVRPRFLRCLLLGLPARPTRDGADLRVHPESLCGIAEPSQHESDGCETHEGQSVPGYKAK